MYIHKVYLRQMHKYIKITAYPFIYLVQFLAMWSSPRIYACSALRTHLSQNIASTGLKCR